MNKFSVLLTDQYELVMAYCYWRLGMAERDAVFEVTFRRNPFQGNYTVCCGLDRVIELLTDFHFSETDIAYLATLQNPDGTLLFAQDFLQYLRQLKFSCDVDAIPEGTVVFPHEPLLRVKGPILQCQLLETALINFLNFSSLIATKAARVCAAAQDDPVVEFGVRRAQGPDGGLMASRAAYVGGCAATSHLLAGKLYDIPTRGTQAHSWIMAFPDEMTAFKAFADVMSHNGMLLIDTYDTIQGAKNAIEVGYALRAQGEDLLGVRLDSGDLAVLSKEVRKLLDAAGFQNTKIMASGELEENMIAALKAQQAPIDIWGVGTKLVTAADQPYLDMVYKLTAMHDEQGKWQYKIKVSDQPGKITTPGIHQVRRYYLNQHMIADCIYDLELGVGNSSVAGYDHYVELLTPIFRNGKLQYQQPDIHQMRDFCQQQVKGFIANQSDSYSVKFADNLAELKQKMILMYKKD